MKHVFIFLFVIVGFTISCKNADNKTLEKVTDSIAGVIKIKQEDSTAITNSKTDLWIANELHKKDVDWQNFHLYEYYKNDSLAPEFVIPEEDYFKNYESVLRWSPDSNYVLDIGSYGSVLLKGDDGKMIVEPGEPDSEVSLLNVREHEKSSLFFVGPSSNIFNGKWVNNDNLLVLGSFDESGNGKPDTLFWMVDVKNQFYRMYKWKY